VALDNSLSTWTNYRNRYWPAHYLIDADGAVRHIAFGEGNYAATETLIRELLQDADPAVTLPEPTEVADETPDAGTRTRETFLGSAKDVNYGGEPAYRAGEGEYRLPDEQPGGSFALDGAWRVETQYATPSGTAGGGIRLEFHAEVVRMVLAGQGEVRVRLDDGQEQTLAVSGTPRSYAVAEGKDAAAHVLDVLVSPGVEVYSFTFG
jgi:hypothetical protein